jgi:hypothetical protein
VIVIGIDPGLNGGLGVINFATGAASVFDIPTVPLPGAGLVRRRVDGRKLTDLIRAAVPAGESVMVVCEMVRAMGGKNNSIQTQASLTRTLGAIEAVLDVMRVKPRMVEPQVWKRFYKLGRSKTASLVVARKLFPKCTGLSLAKHHNKAESLLIANWAARTLL